MTIKFAATATTPSTLLGTRGKKKRIVSTGAAALMSLATIWSWDDGKRMPSANRTQTRATVAFKVTTTCRDSKTDLDAIER